MWSTIGTTIVKTLADVALNNIAPKPVPGQQDGHHSIRGHINGIPVDLKIERQRHSAASTSNSNPNNTVPHPRRNTVKVPQASSCSNCNNRQDNKKPTNGKTAHKKGGNSFCVVNMPGEGNFEIKIKKTQNNFDKTATKEAGNRNTNNKQPRNNYKPSKNNVTLTAEKKVNDNRGQNKQKNNNKTDSNPQQFGSTSNHSTWMYLGRLKIGTTKENIQFYMTEMFPGYSFKVEELPLYKDAKLPSFKVLVNNKILEEFKDLNRWPAGVKITKFNLNFKN